MPIPITIKDAREGQTQVTYLRIAHAKHDVRHPYFHRESWSADDAGFVFWSDDGEAWYLDIASRRVTPLTRLAGGRIRALHVARNGEELFFIQGREICSMPIPDQGGLPGEVEVLYEVEPDERPIEISPNSDDSGMAIMVEVRELLRRIRYVDLASRESKVCFEGHRRLGHLQMCPTRNELIMFADQHDAQNFQRIYTVKTSGREHFPFYDQKVGEWVTHECFSRDGKWVTFTVAAPVKGLHIIRADETGARRVAQGKYWHACPSPDAGTIAADMYDGEVRLVDRDTGGFRTVTPYWTKGRRMVPNGRHHPHPCLSRSGRWLLHVDASDGRAALRLIDLKRLKADRT